MRYYVSYQEIYPVLDQVRSAKGDKFNYEFDLDLPDGFLERYMQARDELLALNEELESYKE